MIEQVICEKLSDNIHRSLIEQIHMERQEASNRWQLKKQEQKAHILNRLNLLGVKTVVVNYGGSGDEGSIEEMEVTDPKEKVSILDDAYRSAHQKGEWDDSRCVVPDATDTEQLAVDIEFFCTEELEHKIGSWEVDDGSDGTFTFDVEASTVTCSHEQYYTKSYNNTWEV